MAAGTRLAGKTAVITAAGQGIGRAAAIAFADEGATVWATDINADALATLAAQRGDIRTRRLDVRSEEEFAALARQTGTPQVLFNCAGFVHHGTILDCSSAEWDDSFELNVKSMYRALRTYLPGMLAAGGGSIVNMASVVSSITAAPNRFVYGATKGAVIGLTKAIAKDFATHGIRCNAICPGTIETPSMQERLASQGDPEAARAAFAARQPMGRFGRADEVAALAVYLAGDESAFVTGQTYVIDGGWTI